MTLEEAIDVLNEMYSDWRTCDVCKRKSHFSRQKKPDGSLTIEEITRKAAQEHLSYGQYCAKHNI